MTEEQKQAIDSAIEAITVDSANLQHIARTGTINGSLLMSIRSAMQLYGEQCAQDAFDEGYSCGANNALH